MRRPDGADGPATRAATAGRTRAARNRCSHEVHGEPRSTRLSADRCRGLAPDGAKPLGVPAVAQRPPRARSEQRSTRRQPRRGGRHRLRSSRCRTTRARGRRGRSAHRALRARARPALEQRANPLRDLLARDAGAEPPLVDLEALAEVDERVAGDHSTLAFDPEHRVVLLMPWKHVGAEPQPIPWRVRASLACVLAENQTRSGLPSPACSAVSHTCPSGPVRNRVVA